MKQSGSFGRTQFCRFEVIPGQHPEDYIIISLEVTAAQQAMQQGMLPRFGRAPGGSAGR